MTTLSIWVEISRIMAVMCLVTALAAVTAAVILLVHEELADRLRGTLKTGLRRRTGILMLTAAGVWILVIGQTAFAAEAAGTESGDPVVSEQEPETEAGEPVSTAKEQETGRAEPEKGEEEPENGQEGQNMDSRAPEVSVEMERDVSRDESGTVYCRADNAGVHVRFADEGQEDTGIVFYQIVLADTRGKEIRREGSAKEKVVEIEIAAEKAASLSEGEIRVTAQAEDACGNKGTAELSFILDMTAPIGEIHYRGRTGGFLYEEHAEKEVYFASDVEVFLEINELCGGQKLEADPESYGLVRMTEEPERVDVDGRFVIREDGKSRFGAYGRDLAGNALVVREFFEPEVTAAEGSLPDGSAQDGQPDFESCRPCSVIVRDTVSPVFTAQVSMPAGNPAGIDDRYGIVYYGSDPAQYPEGEPAITASFRVKDQNTDPGRIQLRTAYAPVPEGVCCEDVLPEWKDSQEEECRVSEEDGGEGAPGQVLLTLQRFPGSESTPDGVYRFGIAGTDRAGNPIVPEAPEEGDGHFGLVCENAEEGVFMTGRKVVDTRAPGGELRVENENGEVYCRMTADAGRWESDETVFRPFRREKSAEVAYSAADISPVSVSFRLVSTAGEGNDAPPDGGSTGAGGSFGGSGEGRIFVRGGQIFRIEDLIMKDRAGNATALPAATGNIYLDTAAPAVDIEAPAVKVRAVPEITSRSPDGRPLYGGPVSLEIFASDPDRTHGGSGLKDVHLEIKIEGETAREETLFQEEEFGGTTAYEYYDRITVPASGRWESNEIEVTVTAQDRAGNRSDPEAGGVFRFGTDVTGPQVSVSYDNNEVRNGRYFDRVRTAAVAVRERNFDSGKIQVKAPGAIAGEWIRGAAGEPDLWTMEVRFSLDGAYTLEVSGQDALGNPASAVYAGEAPQEFVIDRTPPLVEVLWDNNDVRNGQYYNRERRATIRVTDLSFDERMVKTEPFARPFRKVSETEEERTAGVVPVYEADIPFTEEGEWTLRCICADLSGNAAAPVPEEAFIIDKTAPRLFFDKGTVQEREACGTGISPVLRCEEENPAPGSFSVRWDNLTAGGRLLEFRRGAGGEAVLPDPPRERAADGACLLSGTACDLAGNRTMVRRNLCVNRFGSLYDISEDEKTLEMINDYYTEAGDPFVIAEYNVSPVTERQITLYKNGSAIVLEEGKDYSVTEERRGVGYKYLYRIDPSAYSGEGKYSFLVESEDETGNYSSSPGRFTSGSDYTASFAVDRTPPSVRLSGVDTQRKKFVADSLAVRLVPSDNMELGGLDIELTDDRGETVLSKRIGKEELREIMDKNSGEVPFVIRASGKWQTLRAFAVDGAGNRSVKIEGLGKTEEAGSGSENRGDAGPDDAGYRVLVNANLLVHLYRSGILPAAAFLALVWAIHFGYSVYKHTLA